jgi:hypothetical protein
MEVPIMGFRREWMWERRGTEDHGIMVPFLRA